MFGNQIGSSALLSPLTTTSGRVPARMTPAISGAGSRATVPGAVCADGTPAQTPTTTSAQMRNLKGLILAHCGCGSSATQVQLECRRPSTRENRPFHSSGWLAYSEDPDRSG